MLETIIPKQAGQDVMIVHGKYRGQIGRIHTRDAAKERSSVRVPIPASVPWLARVSARWPSGAEGIACSFGSVLLCSFSAWQALAVAAVQIPCSSNVTLSVIHPTQRVHAGARHIWLAFAAVHFHLQCDQDQQPCVLLVVALGTHK